MITNINDYNPQKKSWKDQLCLLIDFSLKNWGNSHITIYYR